MGLHIRGNTWLLFKRRDDLLPQGGRARSRHGVSWITRRSSHVHTMVLQANQIVKQFYEGSEIVSVLKGVCLELVRGEIVSLEGPSGSGKTTLLSIVGCIMTPTSGQVFIEGQEISTRSEEHTSELQSQSNLVCRLLLEKKKF